MALIDLEGNLVDHLKGATVAGNLAAPGLWIQKGRSFFRLQVRHDTFIPIARTSARAQIYDEGPEPELPPAPGSRIRGEVMGHWRYLLTTTEHAAALAQWSGECENPTAYWIEPDGTQRILTGEERLGDAPSSQALGWANGIAYALLPSGCASTAEPPGIYRFNAPGDGTLVFETDPYASGSEMWGPGSR